MSSIIKGLAAKEAISPVGAMNKAKAADLMNKQQNQQQPKKDEPKKPEKKKEEQGLHLIAEADNNLVAKQKARFFLDTYMKEHNLVYQKLVDSIYKLAKENGVDHNDLRDAAPDIRYAKQQLLKATENFIELFDEALDLRTNEGQIYSTGGGAGEGWRWYKPQAAGLAEGNPVNVWAYTGQAGGLPPDMKISPLPIDIIGEPNRFVSQRYTYDITKGKAARDLFYNTSIDKANLKRELEKEATKSKLYKDEKGNWVYDVYSPLLQHQKQALKYHLKHLEYMFGDPIKKEKVSKKTTDQDAQQLDEKCWDTHKQVGMKKKGGKMVPNCVPKESVEEDELKELSKDTINDYISKSSAAVRGGRTELPKKVPSWKVAAGKVNPDSVMGKYAKVKAGDLQGVPEARFGGYYNPLDQERREQDSMDYERKKFKHDELSHELRNEPKNNYQVSIDGRAWKVFADKAHAEAVARKLRSKGKKAEVHLTGASPSVTENVNTLVNDAYKASFNAIQKVWTKIGKEPKNDQEFLDLAEQWGYVLFSKDASPAQAQEAAERLATALIPYWHDYHWKKKPMGEVTMTNENLRKWFKEKWVRFGPDGKIRGACARGDDSEGKPKCLPQSKAHSLGKKGRASAASRKRREDPNPERRGKAKNVATKKKSNEGITEGSINAAQALRDFNAMAKVKDKLTYNGIKEAGHADKILNAISACSAFVNHFKNNKDLNSAKIFDTLRSELIAFKNGDITTLYHLIQRGSLDKINFQEDVAEAKAQKCPECGGEMVSEELMNEKKDACYHKVKARYKVWPSAYASGALVKCRKKGASNWGKSKAKESMEHVSEEERKTDADHVVNEYSRAASSAGSDKSHAGGKKNDNAKAKEHKAKSESSIIKGMIEAEKE